MKKHFVNSYERLALKYLEKEKLKFVTANFESKFGEIDLIMLENDELVFVEVRYRNQSNYGFAEETVNLKKQQRIIKTANFFISQKKDYAEMSIRFDVIAINNDKIDWYKNAFDIDDKLYK